MADEIVTLHYKNDNATNVYPNVKDENIPKDTIPRIKSTNIGEETIPVYIKDGVVESTGLDTEDFCIGGDIKNADVLYVLSKPVGAGPYGVFEILQSYSNSSSANISTGNLCYWNLASPDGLYSVQIGYDGFTIDNNNPGVNYNKTQNLFSVNASETNILTKDTFIDSWSDIGTGKELIYFSNMGSPTVSTENIGDESTPVYVKNGVLTPCTSISGVNKNYATNDDVEELFN